MHPFGYFALMGLRHFLVGSTVCILPPNPCTYLLGPSGRGPGRHSWKLQRKALLISLGPLSSSLFGAPGILLPCPVKAPSTVIIIRFHYLQFSIYASHQLPPKSFPSGQGSGSVNELQIQQFDVLCSLRAHFSLSYPWVTEEEWKESSFSGSILTYNQKGPIRGLQCKQRGSLF